MLSLKKWTVFKELLQILRESSHQLHLFILVLNMKGLKLYIYSYIYI